MKTLLRPATARRGKVKKEAPAEVGPAFVGAAESLRDEQMKPTVLVIGADKGGVGKTTVARTLLDYLRAKSIPTRAFDAEFPRGTLKRFHPSATDIVDIQSTPDQMRMLDTLSTSESSVTLIDLRAGHLTTTLKAFRDNGFFDAVQAGDFNFVLFHILGPSIASLNEIDEVAPYAGNGSYFVVKNFINDTSFFEWDPAVKSSYFQKTRDATEITIPKLTEMACEQVELAGVPFSSFISNKNAEGGAGNYSLVLRGYVRTWLMQIVSEYERAGLLKRLHAEEAAPSA
jgi:hypothetical protein